MIQITLSEDILAACPDLHVLAIACRVRNTESDLRLWDEIAQEEEMVRQTMKLEEVNNWLPIRATRQAYKKLGKDPKRYRPSAEALRRRILRGLPLYRIDTLVDLINLVSIRSGYSIGGFDAMKIQGDRLVLGVGKEGEVYRGIGRGELNIAGLPEYRDDPGRIGTPTSDEEPTSLLMIIKGYSVENGLMEAGRYAAERLRKYNEASDMEAMLITRNQTISVTI